MKLHWVLLNEHEIEYLTTIELLQKACDQPAISVYAKLRAALMDDEEVVDTVYKAAGEVAFTIGVDEQMLKLAKERRG